MERRTKSYKILREPEIRPIKVNSFRNGGLDKTHVNNISFKEQGSQQINISIFLRQKNNKIKITHVPMSYINQTLNFKTHLH